ncbi:MAG: hypothetical protein ABJA78_03335 [Ferruginibacter sp.]
MVQKIILFILLLNTAPALTAQPLDCYKFHEGKFRINDKRVGAVIVAERKAGYQTESMESLKAIVRFKISWSSDCSYTLTIDKVIRNENKIPFPTDLTVTIKIISLTSSGYIQEATSSITNGSYQSEVVKID